MNEFEANGGMDDDLIFARAVEIGDRKKRQQFILEQCEENLQRSAFIGRLVDSHLSSTRFMIKSASELRLRDSESSAGGESKQQVCEKPGDWIGPFELKEEIGRGGMAIVFRATQAAPIQRDVAIKIIKPGLETEQVIARMEVERQTLALMNHTGIAAVYDAGLSPLGRPYFAMELVEGESITRFCESRQLSRSQRVKLVIDVCDAVQHAHRRGIIHRDLKPSNILVADEAGRPIPKVIDFGIAKMLAGNNDGNQTLTTQGQIVGTPQYMSPEQATGEQQGVDTRSDIYSLGAVLYELLTGQPPIESDSVAGTLQQVVRKEPAALKSLNRNVPTDLETICLCCLRKDIDQRYATVQGLADDLACFLKGHPIQARKTGSAQRLWMWARRSPATACLAFGGVAGLVAFVVFWAMFTLQLKDQRDKIQVAASLLETERNSSNENFFQAHKAIRKYLAAVQTHTPLGSSHDLIFQQELIESGMEFYDELLSRRDVTQVSLSSANQFAEIQLEQISLAMEYGKVLLISRDLNGSIDSFNKALGMLEAIRDSKIHDADKIHIKAASACISIARSYLEADEKQEAEQASRQAIAYLGNVNPRGPQAQMRQWFLADAWRRLGDVQLARKAPDDSGTSYKQSLKHASKLSDIFDFQLTHAACLLSLGKHYRYTGSLDEAVDAVESAVRICRDIGVRCTPTLPRYDLKLVDCLEELARCQYTNGHLSLARATLDEAIALKTTLVAENPGVEQIGLELVLLYEQKVEWLTDPVAREEAVRRTRQWMERFDAGSDSPRQIQIQVRMLLAAATRNQANDELTQACRRWQTALDLVNQIAPDFQPAKTGDLKNGIHYQLARSRFLLMEYEESLRHYSTYRDQNKTVLAPDRMMLAVCLSELGRHQEAMVEIEPVLSELQSADPQSGFGELVYLPLVQLHALVSGATPVVADEIQSVLQGARQFCGATQSADSLMCRHQAFALCRLIELLESLPSGAEDYESFITWAEGTALNSLKKAVLEGVAATSGAILNDPRVAILQRLPEFDQLNADVNSR